MSCTRYNLYSTAQFDVFCFWFWFLPVAFFSFAGNACERQLCETKNHDFECSGHGKCVNLEYAAREYGPPQHSATALRKEHGPMYNGWDKNKMYGCYCDFGWQGPACHERKCPKGDDPRTTGQSDTVIRIVTSGTSGTQIQGFFTFHFLGFKAQLRANSLLNSAGSSASFTNAECVSFITTLSNVATATCTVSARDSNTGGATYSITLTGYPQNPLENRFYFHSGAPSVNDMGCSQDDITAGASTTCAVTVTTAGTKEYATCSNRGTCDFITGKCSCNTYFYGSACETQGILDNRVHGRSALLLDATSSSYNGNLLETYTKKAPAPDFKLITMAAASGTDLRFSVDGTNKVQAGGIVVATGVAVQDGGAKIARKTKDLDVVTVSSTHSGMTNDILQLHSSNTNSGTGFNFLKYSANNVEKLRIDGTGKIDSSCDLNPTSVTEGCLITAGGMGIPGNLYGNDKIVTTSLVDSIGKTSGSITTPGGVGVGKRAAMGSFELVNAEQYNSATSPGHIYMDGLTIYTVTVSSQYISASAGATIVQSPRTGTLSASVSGTVVSFTIAAANGLTWATNADISIGGVAIAHSTISSVVVSSAANSLGDVVTIESSMTIASSNFNLIKCNIDKDRTAVQKFLVDGTGLVTIPAGLNLLGARDSGERGGLTIDAGGWTIAGGNFAINTASNPMLFSSSSSDQSIDHTGANTGNPSSGAAPLTISTHNSAKIKIVGGQTDSSSPWPSSAGVLTIGKRDDNGNVYSGSLGLKTATPIRFDGSNEDSHWLSIAVGDPQATHTITLPVIYTANVLSSASASSSQLNSLGTLTGLAVTSTVTLSTTTGVKAVTNTRTTDFVGNLVQLDTRMTSAANFNLILSRQETTDKFKVDGTGKMTAAGGAHAITTGGINMYLGDFTLTSNAAQRITHTGSSNNYGLTISSNVKTIIGGNTQVSLGSSSDIQTFGNNHPIQFDGDTVDSNYLILDVGNGPTGSSKTLTLPIDSTATVVASASTLAVTIQTSHAGGVTVESAKHVDNAITETSGSTFLSLEGVRFEDGAVSAATAIDMSSHLTNAGGDVLFTGSADQDITKSGGGDLTITNSVANDFVHVESWKFKGTTVDSTGNSAALSIDGLSTSMEKFQCSLDTNCFYKDSIYIWSIGIDASSINQLAGVTFTQAQTGGPEVTGVLHTTMSGYESWTFALAADHGLTKAVGAVVTQGSKSGLLQTALTGSGTVRCLSFNF